LFAFSSDPLPRQNTCAFFRGDSAPEGGEMLQYVAIGLGIW
jgi:hypothetical protein